MIPAKGRALFFLLGAVVACQPSPGEKGDTSDSPDDTADTGDSGPDSQDSHSGQDTEIEEVPGTLPPVHELCTISLACEQEIVDEPKHPCELEILDAEGEEQYRGVAGVEIRGRLSQTFPKLSYGIELWEEPQELMAEGASWRYLDTGVAPSASWIQASFDDSAWKVGSAPLGYDAGESTTVSYGPDPDEKHITTWLRGSFDVADPSSASAISVTARVDDGAVLYLNGVEIARLNMPEGEISASTLASRAVSKSDEDSWSGVELSSKVLVPGQNVLAVELHQASVGSSDLLFDARVLALGQDRSANILGMGGESDWVALAQWADRSFIRNKLMYDLFQGFGGQERYAAETTFCTLELNGAYQGVYLFGERIERDDDRVDIEEDASELGRSFIVKTDDQDTPILKNTVGWGDWVLVYPKLEDSSTKEIEGVVHWLDGWQQGTLSTEPWDKELGVFAWLDQGSAIDFLIIEELSINNDAYTFSVHLAKDIDGKMRFVPWDFDLAFGYPAPDCGVEGWARRQTFVYAMTYVPGFNEALAARWRELRSGLLADDVVMDRIERYREVLEPEIEHNFERWPWDETVYAPKGTDLFCAGEDYDAEYERIRAWILDRMAWIDDNIDNYDGKSW